MIPSNFQPFSKKWIKLQIIGSGATNGAPPPMSSATSTFVTLRLLNDHAFPFQLCHGMLSSRGAGTAEGCPSVIS